MKPLNLTTRISHLLVAVGIIASLTGIKPAHAAPDQAGWTYRESLESASAITTTVVPGANGVLDVFALGRDHELFHGTYTPNTPKPKPAWGGWNAFGGYLTTPPTVVPAANGVLDVFALGRDHELFHGTYAPNTPKPKPAWGGWNAFGGYLTTPPTVVLEVS